MNQRHAQHSKSNSPQIKTAHKFNLQTSIALLKAVYKIAFQALGAAEVVFFLVSSDVCKRLILRSRADFAVKFTFSRVSL